MRSILTYLISIVFIITFSIDTSGQTVFWFEDFDDGGGGRWTLENAPGSGTNPTPLGIVGLTYGVNNPIFDNFIINDRNTPELSGAITVGTVINNQGTLVRGRHYACSAPSNLPNPFINTGAGPNQSLHITAHPACATLLYGGTPQSDDWNCISDPNNGDPQTSTEQIAYFNQNIDATGRCNIKITADFFLGGDSDGIKSHSTILYSVDGGATWKIVQDNLRSCSPFLAGTCNNWFRRSFILPSDADNQNDLRVAFRWYDDGDINNTGDYALGASFNVDNVMLSSCDPPTVDFIANSVNVCKNETITLLSYVTSTMGLYTNCFSVLPDNCGVSSYSWNIPGATYVNGTSSTDPNPEIIFTVNGTYTVELTASSCGGGTTVTKTNFITVANCPPVANFIADILTACIEPTSKLDTVTFTDLSTTPTVPITSWSWTFTPATVTYVNGTSSTDPNPQVTFNAPGTYQVSLQVTSAEGTDTKTIVAYIEAISCECAAGGAPAPLNVYFEDFEGNPCNSGCDPSMVAWTTTNTGTNSGSANKWYVSCAENGQAAGMCGAGCGSDESLHLGSTTLGDIGAAYDAGQTTNKRVESPTIDCSGASAMTLNFNYIMKGELNVDFASLLYFDGAVWNVLTSPLPQTAAGGCAPQGLWTNYAIPLPPSANNNANVKIGFNWTNNGSSGSDPSFAVDDISIDGTGVGGGPSTTWEGTVSTDWNTAANWSSGTVPTITDDALIPSPANLIGAFMPTISTVAVARNVCNFGTITIAGNNTLTIEVDLLNEGVVTTTTTNNAADVIFITSASVYRGSGTMYDVDVSVTSSDLTLESDLIARSLIIATTGAVDLATFNLTINKNLTKTSGTLIATNAVIYFVDACGTCVDPSSNADVTLNTNQAFGDIFINKTAGVKTSLLSNVNHTFTSPKTVTIQSGILDVNTNTLIGTGNLTMTGGELQLAKCVTVVPELTGAYSLTAGKVTFDGVCNQTVKVSSPSFNYYDVEFTGTGIKSLDNADLNINNQLELNLPITTGNYVDAGADMVILNNNNTNAILRTGGHIVGNLSRAYTPSGGTYNYYVGSDYSDVETFYEPIYVTPQNLTGATYIIANFNDANPNPGIVNPGILFGFSPPDTIIDVEDEGYWHLETNTPITGGTYEAMVSPDIRFWTFTYPWASGRYTLLKQTAITNPWDYTIGGVRVDDSTTTNFADFSNYALAFANDPLAVLPVELIAYQGNCDNNTVLLSWVTATELNSEKFMLERSYDGITFEQIATIPAAGYSNTIKHYNFEDEEVNSDEVYYRLLQKDYNAAVENLGVIYVGCEGVASDFDFNIFPNPTTGLLNASIFSLQKGEVGLTIYDISGSIIYNDLMDLSYKGLNIHVVDLRHLSNGVYFINARLESGETKNHRLVITH